MLSIRDNDNVVSHKHDISIRFNEFFVDIGCKLAKQNPITNNNPLDYVSRHNCKLFFMYPTTDCESLTVCLVLKIPVVGMMLCPPKL